MRERSLRDDLRTPPHGGNRCSDRLGRDVKALNSDDLEACLRQVFDIVLFVDGTSFPQNLQQRVGDVRFLQIALGHAALESGAMAAVQVADEIGRAQLEGVALFPHDFTPTPQLCLRGRNSKLPIKTIDTREIGRLEPVAMGP